MQTSQLTPSQARFMDEARARRARLAAAAASPKAKRIDPPLFPIPVRRVLPALPIETPEEWAARQVARFKTPWFHIVEEIDPPAIVRPQISLIQRTVAKYFGVRMTDFLSARRTANLVGPRQVAMFLCKDMTLKSLPEIGRKFTGRDHTTVLHAVRKIAAAKDHDSKLADDLDALRRLILEGMR